MRYDKGTILHGNQSQQDRKETSTSFSSPGRLDAPRNRTRMAGEMGARALELLGNPEEAKRTSEFMELFADTNEGTQFNQAKMMKAAAAAQAAQPAPEKSNEGQSA